MDKHTKGNLRIGVEFNGRTHNPSMLNIEGGDSIASVYGVPLHCRLEEIAADPRWSDGLANARRLALCWNSHEELVAALCQMIDEFDHPYVDDRHPCSLNARALLAKIAAAEKESEK